ncbi:hypothetical protein PORY_002278 [Pneumocystis oryctolagi]|uniref:Uncharacterized protein n=1 Tax=Pneumocystis oryctolagi TaxID=42067 RepID=A0ACB7C9S3_9ASCO|nr:hypothetical protein PORY_002278 [Pneumocystis oryctolagi]
MVLTESSINPSVLKAHYGIRGEIFIKAEKIKKKIKEGNSSDIPFRDVIDANIGNPQKFDHKPITFFRQVLSLVEYPDLLKECNIENTRKLFPEDAINRANTLLTDIGKIGAYSTSQGLESIRKNVSKFIEDRDGYPSSPDDIFLTGGASSAAMYILQMLISHNNVGIMIPIPQYPLYDAAINLYNGKPVPYYLDENNNWFLNICTMEETIEDAEKSGVEVKAIVVINPGNPTGSCLNRETMENIIEFCEKRDLLLIADEVYQENVYDQELEFVSFKKVLRDLQSQYPNRYNIQLVSFHSVSKGTIGECGIRGGYLELTGFDDAVKFQLYKLASISLCPSVPGQIMVDLMVNPPKENDVSYRTYREERDYIKRTLKMRAKKLEMAFDEMEGVECQRVQGAMYMFPRINIPKKAIQEAEKLNKLPDEFYCIKLLEATGVSVVPGSSFGQCEGTYHYRTTFLSDGDIDERLKRKVYVNQNSLCRTQDSSKMQSKSIDISKDQKNNILSYSDSTYTSKISIDDFDRFKNSKEYIKSHVSFSPLPVKSIDWKKNIFSQIKKPPDAVSIEVPHNSPPSWIKTYKRLDVAEDSRLKKNSDSLKLPVSSHVDHVKIQNSIKKLLEGTFSESCEGKDKEVNADVDGFVKDLKVRLLKHQIIGLRWLQKRENSDTGKGGILADDMGLGKTVQTIALIVSRKRPECFQNLYSKSTLVVAPLSIIRQWESEIVNKTNLSVLVYHGVERNKHSRSLDSYDVVITTYNILVSEMKNISDVKSVSDNKFNINSDVFKVFWWRIVLDEAQIIKNKNSKTAIAVYSLKGCNRWCLTGTPIQNSVEELYSLFKFLRVEPLNDFSVWKEQISKTISQGNEEVSLKRLKVILNSIMIRRTKSILLQNNEKNSSLCLPKRIIKYEMVKLDKYEREFYDKLELYIDKSLSKFVKNKIKGKNYTNILCLLLRLRQACNHFELVKNKLTLDKDAIDIFNNVDSLSDINDYVDDMVLLFDNLELKNEKLKCDFCLNEFFLKNKNSEENKCENCQKVLSKNSLYESRDLNMLRKPVISSKIKKMIDILQDNSESHKTIVFSQFTSMLDLVELFLKIENIKFVRYDGSMPYYLRESVLKKLHEYQDIKVLLCSLKSGALGLNLTIANRVILLDIWWNPAVEEQAIDRVYRIGQTKDVIVYKIIVENTIEQRILMLQEKKKTLIKETLNDEKNTSLFDINKLTLKDILFLFNHKS